MTSNLHPQRRPVVDDATHFDRTAVTRYSDQLTYTLPPLLKDSATAQLARRLVAVATRHEAARLCGHTGTATRELASYHHLVQQLGHDPLT